MARFRVVDAMSRNDSLEGFIADGQLSAALAPEDSKLQEGPDPLGILCVSGICLLLAQRVIRAAPGWALECDVMLFGDVVDSLPADADGCRNFHLGMCAAQPTNLIDQSFARLLAGIKCSWWWGRRFNPAPNKWLWRRRHLVAVADRLGLVVVGLGFFDLAASGQVLLDLGRPIDLGRSCSTRLRWLLIMLTSLDPD